MIDGRFDQHFIEIFAGEPKPAPEGQPEPSLVGPLLLSLVMIGLALAACLPVLP